MYSKCLRNFFIQVHNYGSSGLSYLIETSRPVLMLMKAGNILTDTTACRLIFGRHIDLILKQTFRITLNEKN